MEWVERQFSSGRILVSTARTKRFREFGFVEIKGGEINDRYLMMYRF
jgi:hypothetical protein